MIKLKHLAWLALALAGLAAPAMAAEKPNCQKLSFTVPMENQMMAEITATKETGKAAATAYLKTHSELLGPWLQEVATHDGKPGLSAVQAALGVKA